jgi:hypothetical protein
MEYTPLTHQAEDWLRAAIVRILRNPDYLDAFAAASKRGDYLEHLVFAEGATVAEPADG